MLTTTTLLIVEEASYKQAKGFQNRKEGEILEVRTQKGLTGLYGGTS